MTIRVEDLTPAVNAITLFLRDETFDKKAVKAAKREFARVRGRRDMPFKPTRAFRECRDELWNAVTPALKSHGLTTPSSDYDVAVVIDTMIESLDDLSKWSGKEVQDVRRRLRARVMWIRTTILNFSKPCEKAAAD